MQLDIFDDSRDVMLRNDVVHALERRDASQARGAWAALAAEFPEDSALQPLDLLVGVLEQPMQPPFADPAPARAARIALVDRIEPAARLVIGARAGAWLAPVWSDLARRAEPLPFRAEHAEDHTAPLWLHAGDAAAAAAAVARIESWRRIPAPLAWLAPARFDAVSRRLADPALDKLRKAFDAEFDGIGQPADLAWFPAWVLTCKAGAARWLGAAQPSLNTGAEQAMRLMLELIGLERQGRHHEMIERRKHLRGTHAGLYAAYMQTR